MNETIRDYARTYTSPVKQYHLTLWDALEQWGLTEGLLTEGLENDSNGSS